MTMVATVVRVGRQADMNNRVAAIDEKIDALAGSRGGARRATRPRDDGARATPRARAQ